MNTILLHFGEPKCASSSIQLSLSLKSTIIAEKNESKHKISYFMFDGQNFFRVSDLISDNPNFLLGNGLGYFNSTQFSLSRFYGHCIHEILRGLIDQLDNEEIAILSFEKWGENFIELSQGCINPCACLNPPKVIGIQLVRNFQAAFLSSYLQWGLWDGGGVAEFALENQLTFSWGSHIKAAYALGFEKVFSYVLDRIPTPNVLNIFTHIFKLLNIAPNSFYSNQYFNSRITEDEFLLFRMNSSLRDKHSPQIQMLIDKYRKKWNLPSEPLEISFTEDNINFLTEHYKKEIQMTQNNLVALDLQDSELIKSIANWKIMQSTKNYEGRKPSLQFLEKLSVGSLLELYDTQLHLEARQRELYDTQLHLEATQREFQATLESILQSRSYRFSQLLSKVKKKYSASFCIF